MQTVFEQVKDEHVWHVLPPTQYWASIVFRLALRPGAFVHQLLHARLKLWPLRVFLLIHPQQGQEVARQLLLAPRCQLDGFCLMLRERYPTEALLLGAECRALMSVVAQHIMTTSWHVERLHSKNARRLRSRCHTHDMDAGTVAVMHAAANPLPWATSTGGNALQGTPRGPGRPAKASLVLKAPRTQLPTPHAPSRTVKGEQHGAWLPAQHVKRFVFDKLH